MTESMIYWITRLDGIHGFCFGIQTIAVISTVIGAIVALVAVCIKVSSEVEEFDDGARVASGICKIACKV